jgi:hypothetical protein
LPSGKFATNALVLARSMLAFNLLRWIGQNGLAGPKAPRRHKAKRRRIRTVIQELMYVAARVVQSGSYLKLCFGKGCRSVDAFTGVYHKLAMVSAHPLFRQPGRVEVGFFRRGAPGAFSASYLGSNSLLAFGPETWTQSATTLSSGTLCDA